MLDDFAGNQFDGGKMLEILKALELDQQGQTAIHATGKLRCPFDFVLSGRERGLNILERQ